MEVIRVDSPPAGRIVVRLLDDDGRVGLAEARPVRPSPMVACIEDIRRIAIGAPVDWLSHLMRNLLGEGVPASDPTWLQATVLIENACWDLSARSLGVPLSRLTGGAVRDSVKVCASGWEPSGTGEALHEAARRVVELGFRVLRFDPFGHTTAHPDRAALAIAVRACATVRAAVGPDINLWIGMGGRLRPSEAIRFAQTLERLEPTGLVDSVGPDHRRSVGRVADRSSIPVSWNANILDRHDLYAAIVAGRVDVIDADPGLTGMEATRTLAHIAASEGVRVILRATGGAISRAWSGEIALGLGNLEHLDLTIATDPEPAVVSGGQWMSNERPGIGIDLDR